MGAAVTGGVSCVDLECWGCLSYLGYLSYLGDICLADQQICLGDGNADFVAGGKSAKECVAGNADFTVGEKSAK